ncbi:aminoglycoside adenylyltransferase domain-containing protein [Paenibacillus piscarius]|uniref:aminoglycoside adenylyltransferase domain-containing protein n=1 Tax=Paenibacillus piscarius TaxID=1089681 RepID=UPI001EE87762|nr:aminoglycoside adenylyltransferase domain-containing protein [Paenibacillus piscarius]
METLAYLDHAVELFKEELGANLAGIYLHGSLAMGCFSPETGDIDLLIVVHNKLSQEVSRRLAKRIVALHDMLPNKRGVELSIVLKTYLRNFVYPTPFEFHFSEAHIERYRTDEQYLCGGFEDADLAAHFYVVYHRGVILYGEPIREAFLPVDRGYYLDSIMYDVGDAHQKITEAPVYYTLNLCRVLYYVCENVVSSKKEGGEWGKKHLPAQYHGLLTRCLEAYSGSSNSEAYDPELLTDYAEYMINEIERLRGNG